MSESSNSYSIPDLPSPTTASAPSAGVGLGYGIAIAVGILVLVSAIMLASYLCVRIKSYPHQTTPDPAGGRPTSSSSQAPGPTATVILGLDGPTIASYPKFAYHGHGHGRGVSVSVSPEGPCAICLGEYAEGDAVRRVPECGHCFHCACIDEWLRTSATCPVCRSSPLPTPLSELIPLRFRRH